MLIPYTSLGVVSMSSVFTPYTSFGFILIVSLTYRLVDFTTHPEILRLPCSIGINVIIKHNSLKVDLLFLLCCRTAKVMITAKKVMIIRIVISVVGTYIRIIIATDSFTGPESGKKLYAHYVL